MIELKNKYIVQSEDGPEVMDLDYNDAMKLAISLDIDSVLFIDENLEVFRLFTNSDKVASLGELILVEGYDDSGLYLEDYDLTLVLEESEV